MKREVQDCIPQMSRSSEEMLKITEHFMHPYQAEYHLPEDYSREDLLALYQLSLQHKLDAAVYEIIHQDPVMTKAENQPLAMQWKQSTFRGVLFQVQRTEGFLELYKHLREEGVKPLIIKGLICRQFYTRPDMRISGDEDILVKPSEFAKCDEVMLADGFNRQELDPSMDASKLPYEIQYIHPRTGVYIEVHLSLFPEESGAYGHLNQEFERAHQTCISEEIQGVEVWTLDPTLHLLFLICHSMKHFLHSGFGIRQLCDMVMMAEQDGAHINWKYIQYRLQELHMETFWDNLVEIGIRYLGFSPEKACYPGDNKCRERNYWPLLADMLDSGIYGDSSMERKHSSNITLTAAESGKKDTVASLRTSLFPKLGYMRSKYHFLRYAPWLLPVAWMMRICQYLRESRARKQQNDSGENSMEIGMSRVELLKTYGIIK